MALDWLRKKLASDPRQAAGEAARAPALAPERLHEEMKAVIALLTDGKFAVAMPILEALVRSNPDESEVVAHYGICKYLLGDCAGALEPLLAAVRMDPSHPRAHYFLAGALTTLNRINDAVGPIRRAIELSPRDPNALILAGTILGKAGAQPDAALYLNQAHEMQPEAYSPLHGLEILGQQTMRKASDFYRTPKVAEAKQRAINRLLAARRKKGLTADELAALLTFLSDTPENLAKGYEIARESTGFEPMNLPLAEQMFMTFWTAGDLPLALRFSEICYERDPANALHQGTLSVARLTSGQEYWNAGWQVFIEGLRRSRPDQYMQTVPMWAGEKLGKKKLLVYQDQGLGDCVLCFRFLPLLAQRGVAFDLWVQPPLVDLATQISGYDRLLREEGRPDPVALGYSYAVPMFGLIPALYLSPEEVRTPPVVRAAPGQASGLRAGVRTKPWWPTARLLRSEAPGKWNLAAQNLESDFREFVKSVGRG
jgi:tetratricopeptide (TPR) repeat protein